MKLAFVDFRISHEERKKLSDLHYEVILCPAFNNIYEAVCGHPDMFIHILDYTSILVHKDMNKDFILKLTSLGFKVLLSQAAIQTCYPQDIILNAVNLSDYFVHNLKYTDKILLEAVAHKKHINVKQGYTKCSTAVINDNAAITSDAGIAKALLNENFDVLLIPPGYISLPGLNYGFIGGCCGLLYDNLLAFYGDLKCYKFGNEVMQFLRKHCIEPVFLRKGELIDRGSIFTINI